ncbi:MAG: hypothetical protein ACOCN5_09305, partial [Prevotella sp.]
MNTYIISFKNIFLRHSSATLRLAVAAVLLMCSLLVFSQPIRKGKFEAMRGKVADNYNFWVYTP